MRIGIRSAVSVITVSLTLLYGIAAPALGQEATAKPSGLTQIGFAAAKSLDALDAFAKQSGTGIAPSFSAETLETGFTFIGKGGLATDKPIGVIICGSADLKPGQMIAYVLPVKPNVATADSLKAFNAKPIPDHADAWYLGAAGLRRTADYVIFSPNADVATAVDDAVIQDAVKTGDALVKISANVKAFRAILPDQYKQMFAGMQSSNLSLFATPAEKLFDTLDRFDMGLSNGEEGLRASFTVAPLKLPGVPPGNRPGMRASVMARADFCVPIGDAIPQASAIIENMKNSAMDHGADGKPLNDDQKKQVDLVFNRLSTLILGPAETSVGVEVVGGVPTIYVVQRWTKQVDVYQQLSDLATSLNQLSNGTGATFTFQQFIHSKLKATIKRISATQDGKLAGTIDVVQRGNDVFITLASDVSTHMTHLLGEPDSEPFKSAMSASLDMDKLVDELSKVANSPIARLSPIALKQLVDSVHNQSLSVNMTSDGDTATLDIMASKGLVQNAQKVMAAFNGGGTADANQPSQNPALAAVPAALGTTPPPQTVAPAAAPAAAVPLGDHTHAMASARQLLLGCISYVNDHRSWPDSLDAVAEYVGGKDALARLLATARTGNFVYRKPANGLRELDKTIVIYEGFAPVAASSKIIAGYGDGHVVLVEPTDLQTALGIKSTPADKSRNTRRELPKTNPGAGRHPIETGVAQATP